MARFLLLTTMKNHRADPVPVLLPWEVLIEILTWLPVKTLMKFNCVSKSWKSLISDDKSFANLHLSRSPKSKCGPITLKSPGNIEVIPCPVRRRLIGGDDDGGCYRVESNCSVVGSCNGLVCLVGSDGPGCFWVQLWNPATGLMSEISPTFRFNWPAQMNLGFCYDDSHGTYKVVAVLRDRRNRTMDTRAHCMGDTTWRKISSDPGFPLVIRQFNAQFVSGCFNWLALNELNSHYSNWKSANVTLQQLVIVSFDMREEAYRFLSLPEGVSDESDEVHGDEANLGVMRNCLCLFHDHKRTHFVVWKMSEYGVRESWVRLLNVSYLHLRCDVFPSHPPLSCLCEDDDDILLFVKNGVEVVAYNIKDDSVNVFNFPTTRVGGEAMLL